MKIMIEIPDRIVPTASDASRWVFEAAVLRAYGQRRISQGRVGELLGVSFQETEDLLAANGLMIPYSVTEFEADQAAWTVSARLPG